MTSPLRQILVHLDPTSSSPRRLTLARGLAEQFEARLAALYAAAPTLVTLPYPGDFSQLTAEIVRFEEQRRESAEAAFQETVRGSSMAASWASTDAVLLAGTVARQALHADLLVLGQVDPSEPAAVSVPRGFVADVLFDSGKPALIIPFIGAQGLPGKRIAIAWKGTRESAHAVSAAMPFLQRAESVHVLAWGESGEGDGVQGTALNLQAYLDAHGVSAQWHTEPYEPADLGDLLLSRVTDLGIDMLVMGCYGHGRMREWVLGGATRTVLSTMTVPVLMAH
jgi:nucleotide-binding universal stress UspA family protein